MFTPKGKPTRRTGDFQPASKAPTKGLFVDGIWRCNCQPRQIACRFQTKNGGPNHGRWFFTCQNSSHKRCGFFLWADEAKAREEAAVLSNSHSEPAGQTPEKLQHGAGARNRYPSPSTPGPERARSSSPPSGVQLTPSNSSAANTKEESQDSAIHIDEEFDSFELSASGEAALIEAADALAADAAAMPPPETPRKIQRTDLITTPGSKRRFTEMEGSLNDIGGAFVRGTPMSSDDVFSTPATSSTEPVRYPKLGQLPTPTTTPTPVRFKDQPFKHQANGPENDQSDSALSASVLSLFKTFNISLPPEANAELHDLLNRYDLRTQGISKGREISRLAVKNKDLKITELQGRITGLEAEKETLRNVISCMKGDIGAKAASRSRSRRGKE